MNDDMGLLSDHELVELTREGEKDAYGVLWERYYSAGMSCAAAYSQSDREDLVVEAYTKILQTIRGGGGPTDSFRSYLYATIRHLALGRKEKESGVVSGLEEASLGTGSVEGDVLSNIDAERIMRVFHAMKKKEQRQVLWLTEVEELSTTEVANRLGISQSNVTTTAQRARQEFIRLWTQDHVRLDGVEPDSEHAWVLAHAGEYLTGKPSNRTRTRIEAHLAECDECSEKLADAQSSFGMFRSKIIPGIAGTVTAVALASDRAYGAEVTPPGLPRSLARSFSHGLTGKLTVIAAAIFLGIVCLWGVAAPKPAGEGVLAWMPTVAPVSVAPVVPEPPADPEPVVTPPATPTVASTPTATRSPAAPAEPAPVPSQAPVPADKPAPAKATTPAKKAAPGEKAAPAAVVPAITIVSVDSGPSQVCYPVVSGTAKPGSTVKVDDDRGGAVSVVAGGTGRWETSRLTWVTPGRRDLTASSPGQTSDTATATLTRPPTITTDEIGGQLRLTLSRAVPGVAVELFVDGTPAESVTSDGAGRATGFVGIPASGGKTVGIRYHPAGCYGPTYTLVTGR